MLSPIIKPQELVLLEQSIELVLIDARTGPDVKEKYSSGHLEGALHADLEKDLSQKENDPSNGGRHPLPDISSFAEFLGHLGIRPQSHVVVYDDKNGANAAARFWWMLKSIGHKQVQVLDGGYDAAIAAGIPISSATKSPERFPPYPFGNWKLSTITIDEVEKAAGDPEFLVIDVRDTERFQGKKEPIDLIAGHIPGAINIPYTENLDKDGFYLPPKKLHKLYAEPIGNRPSGQVIVHCGSGVTACHTLLALDYAGFNIPNLYVGSWSEWSRTNRPVVTEV